MADAQKEIQVKFTGDATQLGATSRKAEEAVNRVTKGQAQATKEAATATRALNNEMAQTARHAERAAAATKKVPEGIRQAAREAGQLRSTLASLAASFSGGILGGGIAGVITAALGKVEQLLSQRGNENSTAATMGLSGDFVRGARFLSSTLPGQDQNFLESIVGNLKNAQQRALDGDSNAAKAFDRLGIKGNQLRSYNSERLFLEIADKFKDSRDSRVGLAGAIGLDRANQLLPFLQGGSERINFRDQIYGYGADTAYNFAMRNLNLFGLGPRGNLQDIYSTPGRFIPTNPGTITLEGVGNEERAEMTQLSIDQARAEIARSKLSTEEQIKRNLEEQAKLTQLMNNQQDVNKRQKIDLRRVQLEAELAQLQAPGRTTAARTTSAGGSLPEPDQFQRIGLFVGGAGRVNYSQQAVAKLDQLLTELRRGNDNNQRNWGD